MKLAPASCSNFIIAPGFCTSKISALGSVLAKTPIENPKIEYQTCLIPMST